MTFTDDKVNNVDNGEEPMAVDNEETNERKIAIRLCKTGMYFIFCIFFNIIINLCKYMYDMLNSHVINSNLLK